MGTFYGLVMNGNEKELLLHQSVTFSICLSLFGHFACNLRILSTGVGFLSA